MIKKGASGQAAIEYLLLLGAGVMLAALVVSILIIVLPWPEIERGEDFYEERYHELDEISDPCLVGWWRFNDKSSGICLHDDTAKDISVHKNHAIMDTCEWESDNCVQGYCIRFNGDTFSKIPNISVYNFSDFTAEFWINSDDASDNQVILDRGSIDSLGAWGVRKSANTVNAYTFPESGSTGYVFSAVNPESWHIINVVRKGTNIYLYVDGLQVATDNDTGKQLVNGINYLKLGYSTYGKLNGYIDDLRLYKCALTEEELLAHCNRYADRVGVTCG